LEPELLDTSNRLATEQNTTAKLTQELLACRTECEALGARLHSCEMACNQLRT